MCHLNSIKIAAPLILSQGNLTCRISERHLLGHKIVCVRHGTHGEIHHPTYRLRQIS